MAHIYRAEAKEALRNTDAALADLNEAIRSDPGFGTPYRERGVFYRRRGKLELAKQDLIKSIEIDDMQVFSMLELGSIYIEENRLDLAHTMFARAHNALQNDPVPLRALCWVRAAQDLELESALADCNRALDLQPGNVAIIETRGLVQLRRRHYAEAIADFDSVISQNPQAASSYFLRGLAHRSLGKQIEAESDTSKALRMNPQLDSLFTRYGLGLGTAK